MDVPDGALEVPLSRMEAMRSRVSKVSQKGVSMSRQLAGKGASLTERGASITLKSAQHIKRQTVEIALGLDDSTHGDSGLATCEVDAWKELRGWVARQLCRGVGMQ
eukprot:SAG25_NODE_640_length_6239_cov_3.197557_1_plen_106_part_00